MASPPRGAGDGRVREAPAEAGIPPTPLPRVGGCLSAHWQKWQEQGAEPWVVRVLQHGYRVPFTDCLHPPLTRNPIVFRTYRPSSQKFLALEQEISKMLGKGALEVVQDGSPGFYSRLFLVEKATGGWRPVIDLSPLNRFVHQTQFKMETAATVLSAIRQGDFMASIDLKDAYFQVPIHPSSRKWLRFTMKGVVYQFKVLCFGLATAPQVFTRVFATISDWAHTKGIRLLRYLDDWLILAHSKEELRRHVRDLLQLCHDLGIVINREKSELEPSQRSTYLGMLIDSVQGKAFPTDVRLSNLKDLAAVFLREEELPARDWQVLLGHMSSLERLVPLGRLRMRPIQWQLKSCWSAARHPPTYPVPITQAVRDSISWWVDDDNTTKGVPLHLPAPDVRLFTDASKEGWGAHLHDSLLSGVWTEEEQDLHINVLEMKAVVLALSSFQDRLVGQRVALMTDNSTVVAYVNKQGGTVSRTLCEMAEQVHRWAELHSVQLIGRYIPGHRNVIADQLSRQDQVVPTEWSLHPRVVERLFDLWGRPMIDLFASRLNKKLPLFCSLVPDPTAAMEDAFQHPWNDLFVYAFPPFALIRRVINRVLTSRGLRMILVAPLWPEREWYPDLLSLVVADPLELPLWQKLLRQPRSNVYHNGVHALRLHAWMLSSESSDREDFQSRLRAGCPPLSGSPPGVCMTPSGPRSLVGVVRGGHLPSLPLYQ